MQPLATETREWVLQADPSFVRNVDQARLRQAAVLMTLDDYEGQPEMLYHCLHYAYEVGVLVSVAPRIMHSFFPSRQTLAPVESESTSEGTVINPF
jgi:hypothetical protein